MSTRNSNFQLAEINIARALHPLDDPRLADFVRQINAVNELAERSPGFVWRLVGDAGEPSSYVRAFPDPHMLVNMSVWESIEALHAYVYRSGHVEVVRARRNWFETMREPWLAMWWVPRGTIPTIEEGKARLEHLRREGTSAHAFTFKQPFAADGRALSLATAGS